MQDLYLNSVIKRWLQEAKRLRDFAEERQNCGDDEEVVLAIEAAEIRESHADEVLGAIALAKVKSKS